MRNTKQKDAVYAAVINSCDHPDAETVYVRSKKIYSSIGLATVYRALSSLSNEGKILRISCPTGNRFDKTINPHAHFLCGNCGRVFDLKNFTVNELAAEIANGTNCKVDKIDVLVTGECDNCNKAFCGTSAEDNN